MSLIQRFIELLDVHHPEVGYINPEAPVLGTIFAVVEDALDERDQQIAALLERLEKLEGVRR